MITSKDLDAVNLSPIKSDFYQIWNELIDTARKISERWDPSSTNESDPGIVLLKVLAAVADKLNFNVNKNILETYMPSAAQMESMRKLCEMMGYNIKYYRSAETTAIITYTGETDLSGLSDSQIYFPKFTALTDSDGEVNYVTTEDRILSATNLKIEVPVIEGQLVQCESDNDNIITLAQLDDNFRYYLPETQVAENGIFIQNIDDSAKEDWEKVDNLNTQSAGTKCFKFGYDSVEGYPYVQFPEDVNDLIEDGFEIYFIRTSGVNGNISAGTLSTFEAPSI